MHRLLDYLRVLPQFFLPHHALSRMVYHITRCDWTPFKSLLISSFIAWFKVDMSSAAQPDAGMYKHFNHFFTRALKTGARPIAGNLNTVVCPVDGSISQIGKIQAGTIFQAKNRNYDLAALLAGDAGSITAFRDGNFATLYLSPRDYHRVHMPLDGRLTRMIYVPGRLFAVNTHTTRVLNGLFARNERVISIFDTNLGPMALIMVGALNVGCMETVWAGEVTPASKREITSWEYMDPGREVRLKRGQEMGRFNMGSTVILLLRKDAVDWSPQMQPDRNVVMGELLAAPGGLA